MNSFIKFSLTATCGALALAGCSSKQPTTPEGSTKTSLPTAAVPSPAAGDADATASAVLAAAEPFETLTEQAPDAPAAKLASLIADAKKAADGVSPTLKAPSKAALMQHLAAIDAAQKSNDRTGIALAAVEGYRTLVESASDTGKVPRAVSLLDYSGFRYQADLSANPVRWDDMAQAVSFAQDKWSGISSRITDTTLKVDFAKAITDMDIAVKTKDAAAARTASTRELDLVDKLEAFFAK